MNPQQPAPYPWTATTPGPAPARADPPHGPSAALPAYAYAYAPAAPPRPAPAHGAGRGMFESPSGGCDAALLHEWLSASPHLAQFMDVDGVTTTEDLIHGVDRVDAAWRALVDVFRSDHAGLMRRNRHAMEHHLACVRIQITLFGRPGMHAAALDILHPVPLDRAVYKTV